MIIKNSYGQQKRGYFSLTVLIAAAMISITGIIGFSNSPQIEAASTTSSCIDDHPCQTIVCSEGQPCYSVKSPNTDYNADGNTIQQQGPAANSYYNDYWKNRQEYLEERQDMMEDAEFFD
jgi:hypothetical protein